MNSADSIANQAARLEGAVLLLQEDVRSLHALLSKAGVEGPRLLTKAQAASYCGVSLHCLDRWRRLGIVPGYVPGTHRFDRFAIDVTLNALSWRVTAQAPAQEADPIEEWKKKRDARKQLAAQAPVTRR